MKITLKFTFDNKAWIISDITKSSIEDINKAIWILIHTLKAKQVLLVTGEEI